MEETNEVEYEDIKDNEDNDDKKCDPKLEETLSIEIKEDFAFSRIPRGIKGK